MTAATPLATLSPALHRVIEQVGTVVLGKREAVTFALVGLVAEGHVLLEDVPGTGKTSLARALARSVGGSFRRIQFTSDLLPSDVTGLSLYSNELERFCFSPGPVFANVVLADELNRTSPRTQSALLECMSDGVVSVDGNSERLPRPFFVIATQNPMDFEGTYPLPESQLDRFLLRLELGYPPLADERRILAERRENDPVERLEPVLSLEQLSAAIAAARAVRVEDSVLDYILALITATRSHRALSLGASPRCSLGLRRAVQALALLEGRDYAVPDDVKRLFLPVVAHRVLPAAVRDSGLGTVADALQEILDTCAVPR